MVGLKIWPKGSRGYSPRKAVQELADAISLWVKMLPAAISSSPLKELDEIVESSRTILDLQHDWDGEGASPIAESTWRRAVEFLRGTASTLWTRHNLRMEGPSLVPLADGSIDLHWKLSNRELLVNIPATGKEWASYYGDNRLGGNTVEGKLNTEAPNHWLFVWLTE